MQLCSSVRSKERGKYFLILGWMCVDSEQLGGEGPSLVADLSLTRLVVVNEEQSASAQLVVIYFSIHTSANPKNTPYQSHTELATFSDCLTAQCVRRYLRMGLRQAKTSMDSVPEVPSLIGDCMLNLSLANF